MSSKYGLIPIGYCEKDGILWFLQYKSNKLIKMNKSDFSILNVFMIPDFEVSQLIVYANKVIDGGDKLYILNYGSQYIYTFDIQTEVFDKIKIYDDHDAYTCGAVSNKGDYLLIFPYGQDYIIKFDYYSMNAEKIIFPDQTARFCEQSYGYDDGTYYLSDGSSNVIYKYIEKDNRIENYPMGDSDNRYFGIVKANGCFYAQCINKNRAVLFNRSMEAISEFDMDLGDLVYYKCYAILNLYYYNSYVYIFPKFANKIIRVNVGTLQAEAAFGDVSFSKDKFEVINTRETFADTICFGDKVYAYSSDSKKWNIFNLADNTFEAINQKEINDRETFDRIRTLFSGACGTMINEDSINNSLDNYIFTLKKHKEE